MLGFIPNEIVSIVPAMCRDHRIHPYPSPREGVAALPYAEIFNPMGVYFAEAAVRADAQYRSRSTKMDEKTYPRRPLPPNKRAATIKPTLTGKIQN